MESPDSLSVLQDENAALKKEVVHLKAVINNLPGSIYWKDVNGVYLGRNMHSASSMQENELEGIEADVEGVVGKTDFEIFPHHIAEQFRRNDVRVMMSGEEFCDEEHMILPNGNTVIQISSKRPLYDNNGELLGIVGNTVDVTYLKKIEANLQLAKEKAEQNAIHAEQANKVKDEFLCSIRHDVRTPFAGILNLAKLMEIEETDPQKSFRLSKIKEAAAFLLDYLNEIIEFSQLESGEIPLVQKPFHLKSLMQGALNTIVPGAQEKGITVQLEYPESLGDWIVSDRFRLQRILLNLLGNALKFTQRGSVTVGVEVIRQVKRAMTLRLYVRDTGIGVPLEKQRIIFEKFNKLNLHQAGGYASTGLGLHVVKQFAEALEGEVHLHSVEGQGAEFSCTFPCMLPLHDDHAYLEKYYSSKAHADRLSTMQNFPKQKTLRVLLVEDNEIARIGIQGLIDLFECELDVAQNGEEALKLVAAHDYHVILMDIGLPDITGEVVTQRLREQGALGGARVYALTAHVDESDKAQFGGLFHDVFQKPMELSELEAIFQQD